MPFLTTKKNKTPLGIYIHVPFCRSKCQYCDFYSARGELDVVAILLFLVDVEFVVLQLFNLELNFCKTIRLKCETQIDQAQSCTIK